MGQKVNPHGLRVGVIKDWDSKWYAEADFADNLVEDYKIRTYLKRDYTVPAYLISRLKERLTVLKLLSTLQNRVSLSVRVVLKLRS